MLTDIQLAILGDRAAQERITERGELLPCWRCGESAEMEEIYTCGKPIYAVSCKKHYCGAYGCAHRTKKEAIGYWNTRDPILTPEQIKRLEEEP